MRVSRVTPFLADLGGGKNLCFVKVETDGGPHGWGECYTQADRDTSIVALVEAIGRYLVGRDARHITHFLHWAYHDWAAKRGAMDFWSAVSGLEQALWDIAGKRHRVPVHELLGGPCRDRVRVYANGWYGGAKTPVEYAARARDTVGRGFGALKFDPFPGPWRTHITRAAEEQAVANVAAVREAVGAEVDLLIEVHRRLAPMHAVRLAREMERFRPFWYEAGVVHEPGGARGVPAADRDPDRHRRGALHPRRVPARFRAARGRHHQSRRVQLRRHPGAARHRPDGRALAGHGLAPQLQQHHGGPGRHPARLRRHPQLPHHRVLRELRGPRPRDRHPRLRGEGGAYRGAHAARPRHRAGRGGARAFPGPAVHRTDDAHAGRRGAVRGGT